MHTSWQWYRVAAVLQFVITVLPYCIKLFLPSRVLFQLSLVGVLTILLDICIVWFCILFVTLINKNYPDKPVAGSQKTAFNYLYLANIAALFMLFVTFFLDFRNLYMMKEIRPIYFYGPVFFNALTIVLELAVLYGMFTLRRLLYINGRANRFDFEKEPHLFS